MLRKEAILILVVIVISVLIVLAEVVFDSRSGEINVMRAPIAKVLGIVLLHTVVVSTIILTIRRAEDQRMPNLLIGVYMFSIILCSLALIVMGKVAHNSLDYYRHLIESIMLGIFFLIPLAFELKRRRFDSPRRIRKKND